ncbi:MAG: hypothetical protein L0G99_17020 [Propionibacteriales bacterium]|nr:hypothetical protein [Propionibacteriales bacterium]
MKFKLFAITGAMALGISSALAAPMAQADVTQENEVTQTKATETVNVQEYWTAEKMKSATPASKSLDPAQKTTKSPKPNVGKRVAVQGKSGLAAPSADQERPRKAVGKIFFTMQGRNYVCSGNSVASNNDSVVSTAGHCLNEGPGAFVTNFVFVPAYENGAAPYGKWAAKTLMAPTSWKNSGDFNNDVGFAVMRPDSQGRQLADVVGSTGIEFNSARGQQVVSYGYPADPPFNGELLYSCSDTAARDSVDPSKAGQGILCDMTGGSSGGPWMLNNGNQTSVNSFGYKYETPKRMYGPYFGDVAQQVYQAASSASASDA